MEKPLYIVIAGCGRLGSMLAARLSKEGHSVVVIEREDQRLESLSADFSGFRIVGDAVELAVLRQAKLDRADCFLATTDRDNTNLMLAQVGKTIFGVPVVIARVFNPVKEPIYRSLGIATISPTSLSVDAFVGTIGQATGVSPP